MKAFTKGSLHLLSKAELLTRIETVYPELRSLSFQIGRYIDKITNLYSDQYSNPDIYATFLISEVFGITKARVNEKGDEVFAKVGSAPDQVNIIFSKIDKGPLASILELKTENTDLIYLQSVIFYADKNYDKAFTYSKKAAEQDHAGAQFYLGNSYYKGDGVKQDKVQAFNYYKEAADQGHAGAQFNLGICYSKGDGVKKDKVKAVGYYILAAEQDMESAKHNLRHLLDRSKNPKLILEQFDVKDLLKIYNKTDQFFQSSAKFQLMVKPAIESVIVSKIADIVYSKDAPDSNISFRLSKKETGKIVCERKYITSNLPDSCGISFPEGESKVKFSLDDLKNDIAPSQRSQVVHTETTSPFYAEKNTGVFDNNPSDGRSFIDMVQKTHHPSGPEYVR
ncbi:MAG: sel1 repeat family protein [Rickettsiales bacterium]|nr:sel1 repeat family protein [Rickettsiales bacterium]